ncbi:MAG: TIGR04551 family protein [Myxococcales bacterium]|nr:TIGR04551 family protein [Myxococcales bacterium]MDH3842618.1 TIGR04551 family protein [Myxococcales bacterium]
MRRYLAIIGVVCLWATAGAAQEESTPTGARREAATEEEAWEAEKDASSEIEPAEEPPPRLRAPSLEGLELPGEELEEAEDDLPDDFQSEEEMAAEDAALLGMAEPPASDPTLASWTNPRPVFSLNGYFRVRGNMNNNFHLSRQRVERLTGDPFARWIGIDAGENNQGVLPAGGCSGAPSSPATQDQRCAASKSIRFANMRLRLQPTLSLSDNIRLHMMVDVFDNLVLGSTPDVKSVNQFGQITGRAPGVPVDSLTLTQPPPESFRNTIGDNIQVRRAWGEVTNSTIGQLRFGRMGHQWGLGMLWNAGEGTNILDTQLDSDFQTEIDRIQLIAKFKDIFFGVSWDFVNKGFTVDPLGDIQAIARDGTRNDDTRQWSFLIARRMDPLKQRKRLKKGKWVFNGGAYFIYRTQFLSTSTAPLLATPEQLESVFVRRDAKVYIPDGWFQVLWKDLRLQIEVAAILGKIQNIAAGEFPPTAEDAPFKLRQWGLAFEGEYRFLNRKLGVFLKGGVASGDPDVVGLSQYEDLATQPIGSKNISTFSFAEDYRIDLILWREILGRVAGAYYFAPAISYDLIHTDFGRVFGAKLDFIYSRAMFEQQTYSSEPNLGAELDLSLYYRTENGPSFTDGFYAAFQYGVLFALNGLDYLVVDGVREPLEGEEVGGVGNAQVWRLILGIQF